jgi:cation diffusion facilitator family transporter
MTTPRYPIHLSILAAVLTLGLKAVAYLMTGSVGLLADTLETGLNLVAALTALFSLWYASLPADPSHTYGHEKIEFFSSGLEGVLILVAAAGIGWYAVERWRHPAPLESLGVGMVVSVVASAINLAVGVLLLRVGRAHGSIILEADGYHLLADVWTSIAVTVGLGLVWMTGREFFDPLAALLMSVNIARTGFSLIRRSFNGLMDHALPEAEQAELRQHIRAQLPPGTDHHALRTRRAGPRRFADFHLLVPGRTSVQQAHDLAERIEKAVATAMPGLELTIHIEPIEEPAAWTDSTLLPLERAAEEK